MAEHLSETAVSGHAPRVLDCPVPVCPPFEEHEFDFEVLTKPRTIQETIAALLSKAPNMPPIGSPENPYILMVPRWFEDKAEAEGTTSQAMADEMFRYDVKVEIVDGY